MAVSKCVRNIKRDSGLTISDWRKFFADNPSAWVYLAHTPDQGIDALTARNAKAYITDVVFGDDSFEFNLNLLDGWTEEDHLEFTIEPVYGLVYRNRKPVAAEIKFLEFVPT